MFNISQTEGEEQLVSRNQFVQIAIVFLAFIWPLVTASGTASTWTTVLVFKKIGMTNCMNISFMFHSVSNGYFLTISFGQTVCASLAINPELTIDATTLAKVLYFYASIFYEIAVYINVFIALALCCSVSMPMYFKQLFTKFRTWVAMCALYTNVLLLRIPMILRNIVTAKWHAPSNSTHLLITYISDLDAQLSYYIYGRIVIPCVSLTIVFVCLVIFVKTLIEASQFRNSNTASFKTRESLSNKDINVIKQVVCLSTLYVAQAIPSIWQSLVYLTINESGPENYFFYVITFMTSSLNYVLCTLNIAIYYSFNSKFRKILSSFCSLTSASNGLRV